MMSLQAIRGEYDYNELAGETLQTETHTAGLGDAPWWNASTHLPTPILLSHVRDERRITLSALQEGDLAPPLTVAAAAAAARAFLANEPAGLVDVDLDPDV